MARFFVPPLPARSRAAEGAYREIRDQAEARTGAVARNRRSEVLECRRGGRDCLLRVGEPDVATGRTVAAIIQLGRSTYTVHHVGEQPGETPEPIVLQQSEVYSTTEFHRETDLISAPARAGSRG
jgi:hypothetical protein